MKTKFGSECKIVEKMIHAVCKGDCPTVATERDTAFVLNEQGRCSSGALAPEEPGWVLLRSPLRVGTPQEPGTVLLRSTRGSELLRS